MEDLSIGSIRLECVVVALHCGHIIKFPHSIPDTSHQHHLALQHVALLDSMLLMLLLFLCVLLGSLYDKQLLVCSLVFDKHIRLLFTVP